MAENKWQTDSDGFVRAARDDEYAELKLPNGDVLITDWEGDGVFNPYVVPHDDGGRDDEREEQIAEQIEAQFDGVRVEFIEWDDNHELYVPYMERPR